MSRLRLVLLAAIAIVIGILGVVVFWVLRLGRAPAQAHDEDRGRDRGG